MWNAVLVGCVVGFTGTLHSNMNGCFHSLVLGQEVFCGLVLEQLLVQMLLMSYDTRSMQTDMVETGIGEKGDHGSVKHAELSS